jgi:transcriptional regulator with XRE-family HTH domain
VQEGKPLTGLRAIRMNRLLTQMELAEKSGISLRAIRNLEAGKSTPQIRTVRTLSDVLNVEPSKLYEEPKDQSNALHSGASGSSEADSG